MFGGVLQLDDVRSSGRFPSVRTIHFNLTASTGASSYLLKVMSAHCAILWWSAVLQGPSARLGVTFNAMCRSCLSLLTSC